MKLTELIDADIIRDGGSFSATFSADDGAPYGLWLRTWPIKKTCGPYHRWLYEFRGESTPEGCPPVSTGSADEAQLLQRLDDFLASPVVRANPDDSGAAELALMRLRQLREYSVLRARSIIATGCRVTNALGVLRDEPSDIEMWRFLTWRRWSAKPRSSSGSRSPEGAPQRSTPLHGAPATAPRTTAGAPSARFGAVQLDPIEGRVIAVRASFDDQGMSRWERTGLVVR